MKALNMKKVTLIAVAMIFSLNSQAQMSLSELVQAVKRSATESSKENRQRLAEFKNKRDQQQSLLSQAKRTLAQLEAQTDALKVEFDENEKTLADLELVLRERSGNLGEMQGSVKILSGDVRSRLENSMISAQQPGRDVFLGELAAKQELPTIDDLKKLWYEIVNEISLQGDVAKFTAPVLNTEGDVQQGVEVIRIGPFNAFDTEGNFLFWKPEGLSNKGVLSRLTKQPQGKYKAMAESFVNASSSEVADAPIDYSRGAILQTVVQTPSLGEKVKQGKEVGYAIIGLGIFGLLIAIYKWISLTLSGSKIRSQLKSKTPKTNNALGRIMKVYSDNPDSDVETMELKMDEAILRETAPLESWLSFIKVLYVIAPLTGLLGTVVGMIETFQMITLHGTGDPKSMAGGISQALVTTVLGLVVAIPLTILHSWLQSMARRQTQILEEQSAGIIARLAEK